MNFEKPVYSATCLYIECDKLSAVKGLCKRHYKTLRKFGVAIPKDGVCEACGGNERLVIDHDHACCPTRKLDRTCGKCVRGVLCTSCNLALGHLKDSVERIEMLLTYITKFP